jgi:hypothetical protein
VKGRSEARRGDSSWEISNLRILDHSAGIKIDGKESDAKERGVYFTIDLGVRNIDKIVRYHARRDLKHVKRLQALLAQIEYYLHIEQGNLE